MNSVLYYVHDPMCSWCWGFSKVYKELLNTLPPCVPVQRVLGGLAAETDAAMPIEMQRQIQANWKRIEETIPGVKFNFDFWSRNTPRRSTYSACRAVIAARKQEKKNDVAMTKAIQEAYYQQARNPSDESTLVDLATELNLDVEKFKQDLTSDKTQQKLNEEIHLARDLFAESFPSLVLQIADELWPIKLDYNNAETMLDAIQELLVNADS